MKIITNQYTSKNNVIVKYFFIPSVRKSDLLGITFSGFHKETPKYNYINAQSEYDYNQLYILDDFGERASYYVFREGNNSIEIAIKELIDFLAKEYEIARFLSIGSSKGATAALFYALKYNFQYCVIGSPQFFVGDYLATQTQNTELLSKMMGNSKIDESKKDLNDYFLNVFLEGNIKTEVYILVGAKETGFNKQLNPFIKLKSKLLSHQNTRLNVHKKITEHGQIGHFFPIFLKDSLVNENLISSVTITSLVIEGNTLKVSGSCFNDSIAIIVRDGHTKVQQKYQEYSLRFNENINIASLNRESIMFEIYSYPQGQGKPIVKKQQIKLI